MWFDYRHAAPADSFLPEKSKQARYPETSLAKAKALLEEAERARIIDRIEQLIRDENWLLYGFHKQKEARYHPALKGLSIESFSWVDFSKLWIKR
ncbi:hypothetical protein EDM54_00930 [Brevibacillus borstelensis]|nr:hypothetical protein X546_05635 [Brevibacillus borstelensis cifa_chp40]RNB66764.1 hypothetical protein EDM54_00930 [Brevibacillus borstelensis]GED52324.1 hypothetical protein BBO01nite_15650 [Brevibacillus borstelensis]